MFYTGIDDVSYVQNSDFKIYPNPANNNVTVYSKTINDEAVIKIFDVIGNELKSEQNNQNQKTSYTINVSDLANGIYILNVSTNNNSFSQKLIIQH